MIFQKAAFQLAVLHHAIGSVSCDPFAASQLQLASFHAIHHERGVDLRDSARSAAIDSDVNAIPFDEPTFFSASQTRVGGLRQRALQQEAACEVGPSADSKSCGPDQFCQLDAGVCNTFSNIHEVTCQEKPEVCTAELMPVCGCDGQTYSNECVAHSEGASVSYEGECDEPSDPSVGTRMHGCETGPSADPAKACEAGQFCQLDAGVCNTRMAFHEGTCQTTPDLCDEMYSPVCGCDGETYSNECFAHGAGISVSHEGECDKPSDPSVGTGTVVCETGPAADASKACETGQFCQLEAAICNTQTSFHEGVCELKPDVCDEMYVPVCGCDGETYINNCFAKILGASISFKGECDAKKKNVDAEPVGEIKLDACEVGSSANLTMPCGKEQFCQLDIGVCDTSSDIQQGHCEAISSPEVCYEMYSPVCGCDGKTYDNDCYAQVAGVSISREGECDSGTDQDPNSAISPGSAFNRQGSSYFHVAIALMTIAVLI